MTPPQCLSGKNSQDHTDVPDYQELLDFLNLRAQAAEASTEKKRVSKPINSMVASTTSTDNCIACWAEKHQLYTCAKFRSLSHSQKMELLRSKNYCLNCLRPGHFVKKCRSLNHCKHCQWPHHTLLHQEKEDTAAKPNAPTIPTTQTTPNESTVTHVSVNSNVLFDDMSGRCRNPTRKHEPCWTLDPPRHLSPNV